MPEKTANSVENHMISCPHLLNQAASSLTNELKLFLVHKSDNLDNAENALICVVPFL